MGRPRGSRKIIEVSDHLVKLLKSGVPVINACDAVGINPTTYYDWMNKGEKATKGRYREFYLDVKKAKAEAVTRNVAIVQKAAATTWQAAAWWLERTHPKEFGKKDVEINMSRRDSRVQINLEKIANSPEILEEANNLSRKLNKLYEADYEEAGK